MGSEIRLMFAVLLMGTFVVLSCDTRSTVTQDAPPLPLPAAPSPPAQKQQQRLFLSPARLERMLHDRINRERRKQGLQTMRWDDALGRIAAMHSKDMAKKRYFSHTSPEGRRHADRYLENGYACGITVDGVLRTGAESIFHLSLVAGVDGARDEPPGAGIIESVMRAWMDNRPDRKNILSPDWLREGIGMSVGSDGMLYVTLNFC